jgi:peptidoglycan/xylan/chitin deacetylase (PgdA/CDA1 family)
MKKRYLFLILFFVLVVVLSFFSGLQLIQNKQACLSLTFDDGLKSHYDVVYPLLEKKNFSATFFIVADETEFGWNIMNLEQIKELSDKDFEIGSHSLTHPHLTELTDEEVEDELKKSKEYLESKYEIVIESIAFPHWDYDDNVLEIARKYYITARTIYNKEHTAFFLESFGLQKDTDVEEVCQYIRYAEKNKLWFVLVFHAISESPGTGDTSVEDFKEILNCAEKSGIEIDSVKGCKKILF